MATVQTTIKRALRRIRRIGADANPTAIQTANHLEDFAGWLARLNDKLHVPYLDLFVTSDGELSAYDQAVRLNVEAASGLTVTLPSNPYDGAVIQVICTLGSLSSTPLTFDPHGMLFLGSSSNASITANGVWRFRADLGDWKAVSSLAIGDDLPFPDEFSDDIMLAFADYIRGDYGPGAELSASDLAIARNCLPRMKARYMKVRPVIFEAAVRTIGRGAYDQDPWSDPWGSNE